MIKIDADGVVKTVLGNQLEVVTNEGWRLIGSYQDTLVKTINELIPSTGSYAGQSGYTDQNGTWQTVPYGQTLSQKFMTESVTLFVVQLDEESVVVKANKDIHCMKLKNSNMASELEKAKAESKKEANSVDELTKRRDEAVRSESTWRSRHESERQLRCKLEDHLAKIRQAIGDLKYKEIVGQT